MFGVSTEMLQKAREIGEHFQLEVINYKGSGKIEFNIIPKDDLGQSQLDHFRENIISSFCSQFYTYFGITGKIVDVNR
jgi:hypothetical protein